MSLPIQTPRQGVFGDSVAVLASVLRDATKFLASTAEVVPGLPAGLGGGGGDADKGKLKAAVDADDVMYGAFINLPINSFLGRTSLGEMAATKATVERVGRILVRNAVYQTSTGTQATIKPFVNGDPVAADVGTLVDAAVVAPGADNPFTTNILKWQKASVAAGNGFNEVGVITNISDDGSEVEIELLQKFVAYAAIT